jgi:hypothetical protein
LQSIFPKATDIYPEWHKLRSIVMAYREAGFFSEYAALNDDDLVASLAALWFASEGEPIPIVNARGALLELDRSRTIADDAEADVHESNGVYVQLLRDLMAISGGSLKVEDIEEDWTTDPKRVLLRFSMGRVPQQIILRDFGDFIDPGMVVQLNAMLDSGGPQFYFFDEGGQRAVIVRATPSERTTLESLTGIQLLEQPPGWWSELWTRNETDEAPI